MKLTKANLPRITLPEGKTDHVEWDDDLPGFGLRLRGGGTRTWIVRYRVGTKSRVVKLGRIESLDPDRARIEARKVLAHKDLGADPQASRATARARAAITLGSVVKDYLARQVTPRLRSRSAAEVKRHLEKHWSPLHRQQIDKITRAMVASRLAELVESSGPIAANRSRASLNAMFGWAMRQGLVEANPVIATAPPGTERSRRRVLTMAELAEIWRATEEAGDYNTIVRLLMLTGARREEVAALPRSELQLERKLWSLPPERSKNDLGHLVPLSEPAVAILQPLVSERDALPEDDPLRQRGLMFGRGDGPFSGWGQSKARLDRRIARARAEQRLGRPLADGEKPTAADAMPAWVLHDLRRAVVTHMNELGIQPHIVEAVVNHVSGRAKAGVAGVYNLAEYLPEKKAALARWAGHLMAAIEGRDDKVVDLAPRRRA
ncbi:MAG TPA: tyrosine-type recombinase/integrase [Geminicoccaceae bacterium]|nr:tyrosine-type recombinase/integrase [Geminicoccaceae bacterium]